MIVVKYKCMEAEQSILETLRITIRCKILTDNCRRGPFLQNYTDVGAGGGRDDDEDDGG